MTWVLLAVFALTFLVLALARHRSRTLPLSRLAPFGAVGVEGHRKLGKETRAALAAATTMLR